MRRGSNRARQGEVARTVLTYGAVLALGALGLQWLQTPLMARTHPAEIYLGLLAAAFLGLGIFLGVRLSARTGPQQAFARNVLAQSALKISDRELEVLDLLNVGASNKEIARRLSVSPNTVKTHLARLFEKLEVVRRTQAIAKARELGLLP